MLTANSHLYHNNGDGTFTEVTTAAGMGGSLAPATANASAWADFNGDGWLDLLVSRERVVWNATPRLFINNRNGTFTDISVSAGLEATDNGRGVAVADFNNDGLVDFFLASGHTRPNWLYSNNGNGAFSDIASQVGMGAEMRSLGAAWADYNNDGNVDLFVANGYMPFLYHNNGDGSFTDVAQSVGMDVWHIYQVACWADYDRDGKMDVFAGNNDSPNSCLFHNVGVTGNYLRVRALTDRDGDATDANTTEDRDAIGVRVEVNLDNDAQFPVGRTIMRIIDGGSTFLGQNEPIAQFGVADAALVAVRVLFPDGTIVVQDNVPVNQEVTLRDAPQSFGSVTGVVTFEDGTPAVGVTVSCGPVSAVTSADGSYIIPELFAGLTYSASVVSSACLPVTVRDVVVTAGQATQVDFTVRAKPGTITGTVYDAWYWSPLQGATVTCAGQTAVTDVDGRFTFADIPAGSDYTVTASATGYSPSEATGISVTGGMTTTSISTSNLCPALSPA